jgi:hypothetical protein
LRRVLPSRERSRARKNFEHTPAASRGHQRRSRILDRAPRVRRSPPRRILVGAAKVAIKVDRQSSCGMTSCAVWANYEVHVSPTLWMATDSRISDDKARLIDQGIKLYEVPYVCWRPGESGFFDTPFFASSIGMAAAGGSLVYQHVYGTAVPVLSHLIVTGQAVPSLADIAVLIGRITTTYVRSLGQRRSDAMRVTIAVGGQLPAGRPEAYKLAPAVGNDGLVYFPALPSNLAPGTVHFIGDRQKAAEAMVTEIAARNEPGAPRDRAALNVIRQLIDDPAVETIGGEVQIGYTTPAGGFRRVASVVPDRGNEPKALPMRRV